MPHLAALAIVLAVPFASGSTLTQLAQHSGHHPGGPVPPAVIGDGPAQPYAGLSGRRVKALSATQEADLRAGRGMALALAAELNGYPGPMHVLEHADALVLTPGQRAAAEALRLRMAEEAQAIGQRMVELEEKLDALFANGAVNTGQLAGVTAALGGLAGRLREVHLAAHIGMRAALGPGQRAAYARLRGYASVD